MSVGKAPREPDCSTHNGRRKAEAMTGGTSERHNSFCPSSQFVLEVWELSLLLQWDSNSGDAGT
ncbi:MAG: hypothetical protein ACE5E7_00840 [Anaerolineae bacterium]